MWTIKKKPSERHICAFDELDEGGVFSGKKKFYEDANQTKIFIRVKTENNLYYRGKKHC